MKSMTEELSELAVLSTSIERLQRLFTVFLSLAEPLLDESIDQHTTADATTNPPTLRTAHRRQRNSNGQALDMYFKLKEAKPKPAFPPTAASTRSARHKPDPTSAPPPWDGGPYTSTFHLSDLATPAPTSTPAAAAAAGNGNGISPSPAPSHASAVTSAAGSSYAMHFSLPPEATTAGYDIPFWELFDVQPSLDWLDVDLGSMPGVMMGMGGGHGGGGGGGGENG
ncbi:Transcription factor [Neofusicoccum parvum]|nr:Transcription factor [Neofusicoccum parvum]